MRIGRVAVGPLFFGGEGEGLFGIPPKNYEAILKILDKKKKHVRPT
jgi:hypothetical protein